jgi:hypothetical protein
MEATYTSEKLTISPTARRCESPKKEVISINNNSENLKLVSLSLSKTIIIHDYIALFSDMRVQRKTEKIIN